MIVYERPQTTADRVSPTGRKNLPGYRRCVQCAPLVHQGDRPDISMPDFTSCMTAIDCDWSL